MRDLLKSVTRRAARRGLDWIAGRPEPGQLSEGYSVLLPTPQDMPFLLRLSLENIVSLDLTNCEAVYVIGDGRRAPLERLERVIDEVGDERVRLLRLRNVQAAAADLIKWGDGGANFRHWVTIVRGVFATRTRHLFLHDIDAFWIQKHLLAEQYDACRIGGYATLGVTPRWDPFFDRHGMKMPATWELMFDAEWARSHRPSRHKGGSRPTDEGPFTFDTMLWPQFLDYASGRVRIMEGVDQESLIHFSGTITTFRTYCRLLEGDRSRRVADELFRILLLSLLESVGCAGDEPRLTPPPAQLAGYLTDRSPAIRYDTELCRNGYGEFRQMLRRLNEAAVFAGERWAAIERLVRPFDDHFDFQPDRSYGAAIARGDTRTTGLAVFQ